VLRRASQSRERASSVEKPRQPAFRIRCNKHAHGANAAIVSPLRQSDTGPAYERHRRSPPTPDAPHMAPPQPQGSPRVSVQRLPRYRPNDAQRAPMDSQRRTAQRQRRYLTDGEPMIADRPGPSDENRHLAHKPSGRALSPLCQRVPAPVSIGQANDQMTGDAINSLVPSLIRLARVEWTIKLHLHRSCCSAIMIK